VNRGFIYEETAKMFLFVALSGTRKNDAYPKFGHEATIEIGIMAYNPQSASYMAAQMPVVMQESKKAYSKGKSENTADYQWDPVAASKINGADVYIQKVTRKNVEIDDRKHEDQIYYFADAIILKKNVMMKINIIYYPLKKEGVTAAITEITRIFNATNFAKYMN
jgi:hypothetical protein